MKIEELNLTIRTYNGLKRNHIDTVEQLQRMTDEDLCRLRGIGPMCHGEIRSKLRNMKLLTVAGKIRTMTDEEMADKIFRLDLRLCETGLDFTKLFCDGQAGCIDEEGNINCDDKKRRACVLRWLRSPAKEE